jgi:chromate reductase, NAD(P)H dehydrogenase (quinone)
VQKVTCSILLISGSVRRASTNTAVLRTARANAASGTECVLYDELAELPHFNPHDDHHDTPPAAVVRLRDAVHRADAVLFLTPEYAGAMSGAFKNLLEWLIGDDQPGSVYEKPVGWVNSSPRGAHLTYESLRTVLEYAHAHVVAEACGHVPVSGSSVGQDGLLSDGAARVDVNRLVAALANASCAATPSGESCRRLTALD